MSDSERSFKKRLVYTVGEDFTKEEYEKWVAQIALWISKTQTRVENPYEKAKKVLGAAINGTRLNGKPWLGVEDFTLDSRIKQLCSFDIITGEGRRVENIRNSSSKAKHVRKTTKRGKKKNDYILEELDLAELIELR